MLCASPPPRPAPYLNRLKPYVHSLSFLPIFIYIAIAYYRSIKNSYLVVGFSVFVQKYKSKRTNSSKINKIQIQIQCI